MHRALLKLLRLQARAVVRRIFRGAKTPRGAIFLIIGSLVFVLWLIPGVINTMLVSRSDPHNVEMYFPLAMLAFCLMTLITTAGERAVAFTPAEADFLFPGPFSRRQLLLYKIGRSAFGALFTATIFSIVFMRHAQHWVSGWIALFLALIFVQLLTMTVVLTGQTIGERAYTRGRRLALIGVLIAVISIFLPSLRGGTGRNAQELAEEFAQSTSGRIVLAPFRVFAHILTSDPILPGAMKWAAIALAMISVMLLIVMRLDAHYLESAATTGQKMYDQMQCFRRGGGLAYRASGNRLALPMPPRIFGVGPIAWRQLVTALRTARAMLVVLLIVCLIVGPIFSTVRVGVHPEQLLVGLMCWVTFMLANMMRFDFRGDLDLIDTLKALPIRPSAIVIAELIAPITVLTICQTVLMASVVRMLHVEPTAIGLIVLFALPLNAMLISLENLIFLVFPVRAVAVSPGDLQGFGRQMLVLMLKSIALLIAGAIAGGIGAIVWWIKDYSTFAFVTSLVVLVLEVVGTIPLLVIAFRNFDPSVDTPT